MITANVIYRVFMIKCGESFGTMFAIDVEGKQYLVTARHVIASGKQIEMRTQTEWKKIQTRRVGDAANGVDISVLATDHRLTPPRPFPLPVSSEGITYGQKAFFLGFPYAINTLFLSRDEGAHPLPLVKQGLVSAFMPGGFLLDGHNNPGFSGGPVVFQSSGSQEFKVAGVISAFRYDKQDVYDQLGKTIGHYRYNTGIIISHDIHHAVTVIRANPVGYELSEEFSPQE